MDHLQASLEIKAVDGKGRTIEGYASAFGNVDRQDDVVAPTFFDEFLKTHKPADVTVLIAHNTQSLPVGIPTSLTVDGMGLLTKTKVFKTTAGDDLLETTRELHAAGRHLGMSIGYHATDFAFEDRDGRTVRVLKSGALIEYSFAPEQIVAIVAQLMAHGYTCSTTLESAGVPLLCEQCPRDRSQTFALRTQQWHTTIVLERPEVSSVPSATCPRPAPLVPWSTRRFGPSPPGG